MSDYITIKELALELRISTRTAYQLAREGRIPVIRIGSQLRVPRAALADWVEAQRVTPTE